MGGDPLVPQPGPMVEVAGAMGALGEDAAAFLPRFYASAAPELKPVVERQLGVRG